MRSFISSYRATVVQTKIRRDRSVRCSVTVENTGNRTFPYAMLIFNTFYANKLTPPEKLADCEDAFFTWSDEARSEQYSFDDSNDRAIAPGETYKYSVDVPAKYIDLGVNDAGLAIYSNVDGFVYFCKFVKDAIEVVGT